MTPSRTRGILLATVTAVVWGTVPIAGKVALGSAGITVRSDSIFTPSRDCVGHSFAAVSFKIQPAFPIPTVSEWGLIVMALLLITAGTILIRRLRAGVPVTAGA